MKLVFSDTAWNDDPYWQAQDAKLLHRLNSLIRECTRTPFTGTGKPRTAPRNSVRLMVAAPEPRAPLGLPRR